MTIEHVEVDEIGKYKRLLVARLDGKIQSSFETFNIISGVISGGDSAMIENILDLSHTVDCRSAILQKIERIFGRRKRVISPVFRPLEVGGVFSDEGTRNDPPDV